MRKICFIISILLGIAFCLAGCAGGSEKAPNLSATESTSLAVETPADNSKDTPSAGIIEPEQLISKQEAEQLLGEAVKPGEKSEQAVVGQKICFYGVQNGDSGNFLQISITQTAFMKNDSQTPESIYTTTKEALIETGEQRQIDGVGDEYFFGTPGLHILKDGYYLCIAAGNSDDDKVQQVLEQTGVLAVRNLEKALNR